jgi:chemotaxis protein methyltransferase CheR
MDQNLTDAEFLAVCRVIETITGLNFPEERRTMMVKGLSHAAVDFGFYKLSDFIGWLRVTILNKAQIEKLASFLTVSETYFWREPKVFDALTSSIIPALVNLKRGSVRKIRIWSVGCSTGEEPYSLAIALHRTIADIAEWDIKVIATDINPKVIEKAKAGQYGQWSFRNSPLWLKSRYFNLHSEKKYEIIPEIKALVSFSVLNLASLPFRGIQNGMDIIFCRNVLMYLTDGWIKMISDSLFKTLSYNGWFVVSSCELGSRLFSQYETVQFPGAILYRKSKKEIASIRDDSHGEHLTKIIKDSQSFRKVGSESGGNPDLKSEFRPSKSGITIDQLRISEPTSLPEKTDNKPEMKSEGDLLQESRTMILSLADRGELEEALSKCNSAIESFKLAADLYLLRASIQLELNKSTDAITSLRQAIYLSPDHIMGHFALGRLFMGLGNTKNTKRYFSNVLGMTEKYGKDDIIPESEGLSVMEIRDIANKNLQLVINNE